MTKHSDCDEVRRLRVEWMQLPGHDGRVIQSSLRYEARQSIAEGRYLLDSVKRLLPAEVPL